MFMDLHLLIIQLYLHTVGFCVDCVTLSPESVDIWENSDVTLFCTNNEQYFKAAGWHINDKIVAMERNEDLCKAYGFLKNETIYSYSCPDNNTFSVTIKKISREWHDRTLRCLDTDLNESNDVIIFVKVPTQTATIYPKENVFTTMENDTHVFVRCISNQCRPEPTFLWYKDHNTNSLEDDILLWEDLPDSPLSNMTENFTSIFNYTLNRTLNGWYIFCVANNSLADKIISDKILLDITYPPDRPPSIDKLEPDGEFRVIEGNYATLTCSVTGGNPLPRLEWSRSVNEMQTITGSTVTKTLSWRASRVDEDILTCTSIHLYENQTTRVNITVLFPPEKPTITMRSWSGELFKLSNAIDVIEQKPFTISCSAISNPPVSKYSWFGLLDKKNSSLYNGGANRSHTEATCYVFNQMKESNSNQIVTGTNSTSLKLNVMYPPEINMKNGQQKTIQEGDHFIYSCNVTHGNPNATKVEWNWADKTWDGQQLILNNVPRNQTGVYQCCAHNWISSSDGIKTVGNVCAKFQLHVECMDSLLLAKLERL